MDENGNNALKNPDQVQGHASVLGGLGIVALILILFGCFDGYREMSDPINQDELYGKYVGDFGETDVNYLELLPDSLCIFYYKDNDNNLYVDTSTWHLVFREFGVYDIVLRNYTKRYPEYCRSPEVDARTGVFGDPTRPGFMVLKSSNEIKIITCRNKWWLYKRRLK